MKKLIFLIVPIVLLSAACNPFQQSTVAGVSKTVNGGADWQFSNTIAGSKSSNLSGLNVSSMAFDPQNRQTVYVSGYNGGLYQSTDSAATWKNILSKMYVYDFAINPANSREIFVAGIFSDHGRALKTTDGGATWQEIYNDAATNNPARTIALNVNTPNQVLIGLSSGDLVRSDDSGITWRLVKSFQDQINRVRWQGGNVYLLLKTKGFMKSGDGGANFASLATGLIRPATQFITGNLPTYVSEFHQFYVDSLSSNLMYMTADKGLYKSTDGGAHWTLLSLPVKQNAADVRAIAVAANNSNIVYTNSDGVVYKSNDGGQTFQTQGLNTLGFVNYILIDPLLPQIVYAGVYGNQ